jgi:2-hydroxychromene-2-carboxylate isomerase
LADVELYLYYGCPWTWFAFTRIRETAMRTGARITWKPVLIDRVRAALPGGAAGHAAVPAWRARYQSKDLADWARFCGVTIRRAGPYPVAATAAARGAPFAIAAGRGAAYGESVFEACFRDGADIDSPAVVAGLAPRAGLDADALAAAIAGEAGLREVERWSDELVERGGFGSPTMFVGDDMYFGNDRMPLVEVALHRAGERPFIAPGAHGIT